MAKAAFSQPTDRSRTAPVSLIVSAAVALLIGVSLTFSGPAATVVRDVRGFLEFYSGVFCLVSLSITVMVGLAATDRIVLMIRHRILLQAAHRAMALTAMTFLGVHIVLKILEGHASVLDAVVPFLAAHRGIYIGLGTIASFFMILSGWSGVRRSRFAGSPHPGLWRALHASAYLSWPLALVHGLEAGRHARTWVTVSYVVCVILVVVGLLVRLCVSWNKRMSGPKATTSGTIRAVGKLPPRSEPVLDPLPSLPPPRREPVMSSAYAYEESDPYGSDPYSTDPYSTDPYGVEQPVSRGRLAVASRRAESRADDWLPDRSVPLYGDLLTPAPDAEPTAPRARSAISAHSHEPPVLTFLDETPVDDEDVDYAGDDLDEPEPYAPVGRHSGEYLRVDAGAYRETSHAEPDHAGYAEPEVGYADAYEEPYADEDEPVVQAPRRGRRRARADIGDTPGELPATRKPAGVLTDEEFWAHMRGDAPR
jgi:hypothetical protein